MRMKTVSILLVVLLVAGSVSLSFAALLGVVPGLPNLQYDSNGVATYTSSSTSFTLTASPLTIVFPAPLPPIPRLVNPTGAPASEVVAIGASISNTGTLLGGIVGDDLIIRGQVDADGNGSIDYAGVLLTGEIVAFGYENTSVAVGGTDRYDFRFSLTGGLLASFFAGKDIGVTVTSEHSNFDGDFGLNFTGGAKGSVGPIPRLNHAPVCSANGPYREECSGGFTTLMLDGSQSSDQDEGTTLTYSWTTDCPGASFDDASSSTPILSVDTSSGCNIECMVTLSVSDGVAAPQTCQAEVIISDTNNPMITCPDDRTVECNASIAPSVTGTATATDGCDPAPAVSYSDEEAEGVCPQARVITRTWTATDRCGNSATCTQTINVVDTTAPTITSCPGSISVTCEQGTNPSVTGMVTATDNCDAAPAITFSDSSAEASCPNLSVITRTWKATDACGNTATCTQAITVTDSISPSIHCPGDVTRECDQSTSPVNTGTATAADGCDPNPSVSYTDQVSGTCPKIIKRTWQATDACGHSATCVQTITVVDTMPPVITCPPNTTSTCGVSTSPSNTGSASATDNCDPNPVVTFSDTVSGTCPATITRVWKATDRCNNMASCTQLISVVAARPCPRTPGYWKNHRSAWPVSSLTVGCVTYNDTQLMNLLSNLQPNGSKALSDASAMLAKFIISATFNIMTNSDPVNIQQVLDEGNAFLCSYPPGSNPTGAARSRGTTLASRLDDYCNSRPNGCVGSN